jgi:uncharacterized membrane protein
MEGNIVMNETAFQNAPPVPPPPTITPGSPPAREGNGQAIASLVLGIVSFVLCGPFCSIPAVILGHISLGKIRRGVVSRDARGFALAGTVLGWVNIALVVIGLLSFVALVLFAGNAGRVSPFVYSL